MRPARADFFRRWDVTQPFFPAHEIQPPLATEHKHLKQMYVTNDSSNLALQTRPKNRRFDITFQAKKGRTSSIQGRGEGMAIRIVIDNSM
jgi:hypothetical protein